MIPQSSHHQYPITDLKSFISISSHSLSIWSLYVLPGQTRCTRELGSCLKPPSDRNSRNQLFTHTHTHGIQGRLNANKQMEEVQKLQTKPSSRASLSLEFCGFSEIRQLNTISPPISADSERERERIAEICEEVRSTNAANLQTPGSLLSLLPACPPWIRSRDRLKGGAVCELTIILKQHTKPKTKHDFGFVCWPCLPRQPYCVENYYRVQQLLRYFGTYILGCFFNNLIIHFLTNVR